MNGPQHYELAERLMGFARENAEADSDFLVASAQVHATLALVAAMMDDRSVGMGRHDDENAWRKVLS